MNDILWIMIASCILSGLMWLRRAYVGEKQGAMVTLSSSAEHRMSRRERLICLWLGIGNLIVGGFGIFRVIHHHG